MIVYHGSTTSKYNSVLDGDFSKSFPGLYVTDTFERAAIYANAQATGIVDENAIVLLPHAVVIEIEVESVRWFRRSVSHRTLDKCEAIIVFGCVVKVHKVLCDYAFCSCKKGL